MANKVLSIKMDEKDIERLKKYYEALTETGFLSTKTTSLNAFYKHLLLDFLENDVCNAFNTYSRYGIAPGCINPEEIDNNERVILANTYNMSIEGYENYRTCLKEAMSRRIDLLKKNAQLFNEVVKAEVVVKTGWMYEMECTPLLEMNEERMSFWEEKAFETIETKERDYKENEITRGIRIIEESSKPVEVKQKLIDEIKEYEKKRREDYRIIQDI